MLQTLKYLMKEARLFLRHDVSVNTVCMGLCEKKTSYYNVLNSYSRLMYRVFYRHKEVQRTLCRPFRPFEFVIKDADDRTLFVFTEVKDCRYKRKMSVSMLYPTVQTIGTIEQKRDCFIPPQFTVHNVEGHCMVTVTCMKRPLCSRFRYHPKFYFELRGMGAHKSIGKISSEWIDTPVPYMT